MPHCVTLTSHCGGFSFVELWLSICGTWGLTALGMRSLLRTGIEPIYLHWTGGFLTTGPPGKSLSIAILIKPYSHQNTS